MTSRRERVNATYRPRLEDFMEWLAKLLGRDAPTREPSIGFLNLMGEAGSVNLKRDAETLRSVIPLQYQSSDQVPQCDVLFIYATVNESGRIVGRDESMRDFAIAARAKLTVLATENPGDHYVNSAKHCDRQDANIAMVLHRRGEKFSEFFVKLFSLMRQGKSLPTAFVKLEPQIPGLDDPNVPSMILTVSNGRVTLK